MTVKARLNSETHCSCYDLGFIDPQATAAAGAGSTFYSPNIALAPSPAPGTPSLAYTPDAATAAAMAGLARVGMTAVAPGARLEAIASANPASGIQQVPASANDLKRDFVASGAPSAACSGSCLTYATCVRFSFAEKRFVRTIDAVWLS